MLVCFQKRSGSICKVVEDVEMDRKNIIEEVLETLHVRCVKPGLGWEQWGWEEGPDLRGITEVELTVCSWMGFLERRGREESKMALRPWPGSWEHAGSICRRRHQPSGRFYGRRRYFVPLGTYLFLHWLGIWAPKFWQLKWETRSQERGQHMPPMAVGQENREKQRALKITTNRTVLLWGTVSLIFIPTLSDRYFFYFSF